MGVVNSTAHGELIMLGAFTSYWMFEYFGMDPYYSLPFAMVFLFFAFGYLIQKVHNKSCHRNATYNELHPYFRDPSNGG